MYRLNDRLSKIPSHGLLSLSQGYRLFTARYVCSVTSFNLENILTAKLIVYFQDGILIDR